MKRFYLSSIEIERYKNKRFFRFFIHVSDAALDPENAAAELVINLRKQDGCIRAESVGEGVDFKLTCTDCEFLLSYSGLIGITAECEEKDAPAVRQRLSVECADAAQEEDQNE